MLAAALFDERFAVQRAAIIPYDVAAAIAKRTDHTNSWRIILSDRVWTIAGVRDVTTVLRDAQDAMSG